MSGYFDRPTRDNPIDALETLVRSERDDMASDLPGEIVDFDPKTGTATIKVLWNPRGSDGREIDFPDLLEVPVEQPRGAGFAMTLPLKKGDQGKIRFSSIDQDNWLLDDGANAVGTSRAFSFSDGVFVPGLHSLKRAMGNYDDANLFVGTDDHKNGMRVTPDGTVAIEGRGESFLQIVSDALAVLIASSDVEGPGFTGGVRADLTEIRKRLETMKFR